MAQTTTEIIKQHLLKMKQLQLTGLVVAAAYKWPNFVVLHPTHT
jgi:hypothetical protein